MSEPHDTVVHHPLDPLDAGEFHRSAATLRGGKDPVENWRFASIELKELSKQTLVDYSDNAPIFREAVVVCWNREDGQAYKGVVSLDEGRVFSWDYRPEEQLNTEDERWPCGEFVNQSEENTRLTRWTEQDRSIEDTDVVLWYVFGIHHVTRPEEWPVMSVDTVSFWLKPFGFFGRNPTLDVPPQPSHCEH